MKAGSRAVVKVGSMLDVRSRCFASSARPARENESLQISRDDGKVVKNFEVLRGEVIVRVLCVRGMKHSFLMFDCKLPHGIQAVALRITRRCS